MLLLLQELLLQAGAEIAAVVAAVIIGLVVLWIVVSIPVWIAAKVLTLGRAKFTRAMLVTAVGPIVYAVVLFVSAAVLSIAIGVAMIAFPGAGALAVLWLIAIQAMAAGILLIALAFRLRGLAHGAERRVTA